MAWDRTTPATAAAIASSPVRSNFVALDQSLMGQNLIRDPYCIIWPAGNAAAPAHYKIAGAPTIARETTAGMYKAMGMAPSITGSASGQLIQTILNTSDFDDVWQGVPFSWGCWVRSDTASIATVGIDDGVSPVVSDPHSGGDSFEWLTGTMILDASATKIEWQMDSLNAGAKTYFDFPTVILGSVPPQHPIGTTVQRGCVVFEFDGDAVVGTWLKQFVPERPLIITNTSLTVKTAPTGAALIVDVNQWTGSWQSMYATKPQITATAVDGGRSPDGTYQYRCFQGGGNTDSRTNRLLNFDIDQVGSGVKGLDLRAYLRTMQFADPMEAQRKSMGSIGNE